MDLGGFPLGVFERDRRQGRQRGAFDLFEQLPDLPAWRIAAS
jgi:hypothetical protein